VSIGVFEKGYDIMRDKQTAFLVLFLLVALHIYGLVMPHPQKQGGIPQSLIFSEQVDVDDVYFRKPIKNSRTQPDSILVVRVDFADQPFSETGLYPYLGFPQDDFYFDKYMQHLRDFYLDASNGQYTLNYHMVDNVFRAPQNMSYYGDDSQESTRRVLLVKWLIEQCDYIDFRNYRGVIVFHAGAGQESDIYSTQTHTLWSSYLSRNTFRNALKDPDDEDYEDYEGIVTSSGGIVNRVAFLPACEFHADFPADANHEFDILGPLANQFGRILGLPALNGNTSSTAGVGNFCIMGTGTWNFNGKIPPLPSAWVRYFAGWSEPEIIKTSSNDMKITYPMAEEPLPSDVHKVYKVELSDKEYFLIENRQQNFLKDIIRIDPDSGDPIIWDIHTFAGSELYDYSQGGIPIVNLMENSLRGNEWDYHMPYIYDGFRIIGSGLFIWHIDENVIEANLANNAVNGDPNHFGVALEEADGIEQMASQRPDYYMRGGPGDAFRAGHQIWDDYAKVWIMPNDYFGKQFKTVQVQDSETGIWSDREIYSFPTARSYYDDNITMEIYNISESDTVMTFSVRFDEWTQDFAQADFQGETYLESFIGDLDNDHKNEIIYFHSDGGLTVFENNTKIAYYDALGDTLSMQYTYDGERTILIPAQDKETNVKAKLYKYNPNSPPTLIWSLDDYYWAGPPVYSDGSKWVLYLNDKPTVETALMPSLQAKNNNSPHSRIVILDENFSEMSSITNDFYLLSNIIYTDDGILYIYLGEDHQVTLGLYSFIEDRNIPYQNIAGVDSKGIFRLYVGKFESHGVAMDFLHYSYGHINKFFAFYPSHFSYLEENFGQPPATSATMGEVSLPFPYTLTGQVVFKDVDKNGIADVILPHANGFRVYSLSGNLIKNVLIDSPQYEGATGGGVVAINAANSYDLQYIVGSFSNNRLIWFDSDLRQLPVQTKTLARPMRTLPYIDAQKDTLYQSTDDGRVYTISSEDISTTPHWSGDTSIAPYWSQLYGGYRRNAYWYEPLQNIYPQGDVFVKDQTFVYPNPFIAQHHDLLRFRVMTTRDTLVKVRLYSILGQLVAEKEVWSQAFAPSDSFTFDLQGLSSGMYFAIVSAQNKSITMKFAIER